LLGSGEAQERGVVGDTPNLAARLQSVAELDSVVIAEGTRKLLGDLFELIVLDPHVKSLPSATPFRVQYRPSGRDESGRMSARQSG